MLENITPTEIVPEHADKTQIEAFAQSTRFTAHLDETGIGLSLERRGPDEQCKSEDMHFHYVLFADILRDLAHTAWAQPPDDNAYHTRFSEDALLSARNQSKQSIEGKAATRQGRWSRHQEQRLKESR
jgi:hypothetical protein